MANLGSEISRALSEYQRKDFEKMHNSIIRAKNIIQKIEEFPEMKNRTGELEILNLIIEDLNQKKLEVNKEHLINYFTPFAARLLSM
jgi:flagellin-specific chaperone FliS